MGFDGVQSSLELDEFKTVLGTDDANYDKGEEKEDHGGLQVSDSLRKAFVVLQHSYTLNAPATYFFTPGVVVFSAKLTDRCLAS